MRHLHGTLQGFHRWQELQYRGGGKFASYNTFTDYFYTWAFRIVPPKPVPERCPVCTTKPRIICCDGSLFTRPKRRFEGGVDVTVPVAIEGGVDVTTPVATDASVQIGLAGGRLQRCFIVGNKLDKQRQSLMAISGLSRGRRAPDRLTAAQLDACLQACPQRSRY
jgi:hypothetical protein